MKALILILILAAALFVLWIDDEYQKEKNRQDLERWKQKFSKK